MPILLIAAALIVPVRAASPGRWAFPRPAIPSEDSAPRPLDRRYSLWDGQTAPLAFSGDEAKLLAPRAEGEPTASAAPAPPGRPGELFVGVEVAKGREQLKDAVAGLESAGFRADARFPPAFTGRSRGLQVFGWVPGRGLGSLSRLPSVRSVEIERAAQRPAPRTGAEIGLIVGIRRPAGLTEAEDDVDFSQTMRELADDAQFRWEQTAGFQAIPGSRDAAVLVVGEAPARYLGRLLAHPRVVKVQPFPGADPPAAAQEVGKRPLLERFLSYVAVQSPLLLAVTGVLLLPPFRPRLRRLSRHHSNI